MFLEVSVVVGENLKDNYAMFLEVSEVVGENLTIQQIN